MSDTEQLKKIYAIFTDVRLDVETRQPAKVYAENAHKLIELLKPARQAEAKPVDNDTNVLILDLDGFLRSLTFGFTESEIKGMTLVKLNVYQIRDLKELLVAHLQAAVADKNNEIVKLRADIAYAIGRFQGMEMDSAYLEQEYPEWKEWAQQLKQEES